MKVSHPKKHGNILSANILNSTSQKYSNLSNRSESYS